MPDKTDTPQDKPFDLDEFMRSRTVGNIRRGPGGDGDRGLTPPAREETPMKGVEDDATADKAPGEDDQDTPAAGDASGAAEKAPEGDAAGTPEETPEERRRRFKSWDEAEDGYKEAQRDLTRRQQEAARARKEADAARKEAEEYRAKVEAFEREKAEATMYQELDAFAGDQFKEAQKEVGKLDMDAEDYAERSAGIMAQAETAVRRKARELEKQLDVPKAETPKPDTAPGTDRDTPGDKAPTEETETERDRGTDGQMDKGSDAGGGTPQVDTEEAQRVFDEKMAAEGLDPEDPLFLGYVHKAPFEDENGNALDYKARLDWVINETKRHRGRDRAAAKQEANAPLPRNGPGRPAAKADKPPEPMSMDAALEKAREARRVRPAAR